MQSLIVLPILAILVALLVYLIILVVIRLRWRKRTWALSICLILAVAAGTVLLIPTWRDIALGFLAGEAFQDGRPVRFWVRQLEDEKPQERCRAAEMLGKLEADAKDATPALIQRVQGDNDGNVRMIANRPVVAGLAGGAAADRGAREVRA